MIDVTNSKKDWHDFWYSNEHMYPNETKHEYNELVDHLVSTMTPIPNTDSKEWTDNLEPPFNTEAYRNYKQLVDKEREKIDTNNITESLYRLGYKIDTLLSKIISQLDTVLDTEFDPNKVTCSVDDKQVDCDTWNDEIEEIGYD